VDGAREQLLGLLVGGAVAASLAATPFAGPGPSAPATLIP